MIYGIGLLMGALVLLLFIVALAGHNQRHDYGRHAEKESSR